MSKKKRDAEQVAPVQLEGEAPPNQGEDDVENELSRADGPDVRGAEMSLGTAAATPVDRMAAARAARAGNGERGPRNPPQYLVLGQRREDGEYDVLAVRKSKRGADKFIDDTMGLIRRTYLGVTVMRSKIVRMQGF